MTIPIRERLRRNLHVVWLALLTITISVGWFLADGDVKVNLADEGFLWYGTHAVAAGQVPMRDFQAYDPGRYWWTCGWSYVLGDGLVSMRLACVFFQCFGVLAGLLAVRRLSRHWLFLTSVALLLCAWMHPRYKVFEQSIALISVYAGVLLLERPSVRRHFWVGIFGGLAAFIGRNHGAYHLLAFGLLIACTAWGKGLRVWCQRTGAWWGGLVLGYSPQWMMFLFVPGYFRASLTNLGEIFSKGTNLPVAVPWPWLVPEADAGWYRLSVITEGCFYLAFPLFFLLVAIRAWRRGHTALLAAPVFVATACVTLPYMHYVFSRPDIVHLSHSAPALVLGFIALGFTFTGPWQRLGIALTAVLLGASFLANLFQFGVTIQAIAPPRALLNVEVKGQRMLVPSYFARVFAAARTLDTKLAKKDEAILFLPNMPGLYPFTDRLSPIKQIYLIFPATPEEDRALLAEIEAAAVQWVMLRDYRLDGRDDLRFRNTNPIVFESFRNHFELVKIESLPQDVIVLHRRP